MALFLQGLNRRVEASIREPMVTVVIPAYNHEKYVGEAIRSVLDQTFRDFELIIINDGSTDRTEAEILKFKDERIRYYSQENRGLSATLNRGIDLARGEFFNFLPSDDAFLPEKLEVQLKVFEENPGLGVVFSYPMLVDAEGMEIKNDPAAQWPIVPYETKEEIFPTLFERNFLSAPTALIRMECFKKIGYFDESMRYAQDYDLWMRILKHYDIRLLKQPLVRYRWHGENLTFRPTPETDRERAKLLTRAYHELSIQDIFPSLASFRESDRSEDFAKAYDQWAEHLKGSGLKALLPFAETCEETAKGLKGFILPRAGIPKEGEGGLAAKRINLLVETRSLDRGGLEEVIFNMARYLDRSLFHIAIVCVERGGMIGERCRKMGIPVEILRGDKEKEYREVLDRYQIDLLVTHYSTFGIKLASDLEIPVITFLHNVYCWLPDDIFGEIKNVDRMIDRYVAVSEDVKAYTVHRFNIPREKIEVIPNGLDLEQLESKKSLPSLTRKEIALEEADYLFLNVGAFTPAKAHPLIVAAVKEVITEHPEAKVLCVGAGLDPKYESFVRTQIKEQGLEKHVRLLDFTEDLHAYYQMADAFLLPSTIEGWSLAAMEAMAYGLPLILTRVGGAAQVIENSDIGLLVDNRYPEVFDIDRSALEEYEAVPPNVSSLTEAMLRFLREKAYWKEAGKKGREKVRERFDIRTIAKAYGHLFVSTVAFHGASARSRLITQREKLFQDRRKLSEERQQLMKAHEIHDAQLKGMDAHLQQRGREIQELRQLLEARYQQLDNRIEYVLLRMSLKERIKERLSNLRYRLSRFFPKKLGERQSFSSRDPFVSRPVRRIQDQGPSSQPRIDGTGNKKAEGLNFLVFPIIEWELRYQRPQQIAERLARRGHRVFYIRTQPTLTSNIFLSKEEIRSMVKVEEVQRDLYFVTLVSYKDYNIYRDVLQDEVSLKYLVFSVEALNDLFGFRHTLSLVELPFWFPLVTRLTNNKIIYDCMDDHAHFSTNHPENMVANETMLLRKADLVLASSGILFQKAHRVNPNTILVRNAADLEHFSRLPESDALANVPKPIAGYHGAISDWFDSQLVAKCAEAYPTYQFVLIGSTFGADLAPLRDLKNVHLLGEMPYEKLPEYLRYFDACLIPFKITPLTQAASPVKFYEYLCAGKPVVSVALPEVAEYQDVCYYSNNEEEFIANVGKALSESDGSRRERRIEIARKNSWDQRVDQILDGTRKTFPKVSIIIVTYNNLDYLKLCLDSIFRYSCYPDMEIIVVDNHSQDGTKEYLREIERRREDVIAIVNEENKGFAGGNNEGLKAASGKYLVLLNDDTIVTTGWVPDLVSLLERTRRLGMIGPVSNFVGNIQKIKVNYRKEMEEIQAWAWRYTGQQADDYRSIDMLGFFCIMMKREVFEKVGFLDESYEIGMFEDDDYCRRVKEEGYELGYTKRVYIHHEGSVSFKKLNPLEHQEIWEKNRSYFERKWKTNWFNDLTEFDAETLRQGKTGFDLREYYQHRLRSILNRNKRPIAIFPPLIDWHTPVFQRPPHIAEYLSKAGYLVFFCTENQKYDKIEGFLELKSNLYLTNEIELLKRTAGKNITYFICSTDQRTPYSDLEEEIRKGRKVVYEYIDEIHESITGAIPEQVRIRHQSILKDERVAVVATSDKLYQEVLSFRKRNCVLVTNGVEYEHFNQAFTENDLPKEIETLAKKKSPIIGYFGSLAAWFDYDLVTELAEKRPNYEILLIGYSYDGSIRKYSLDQYKNISVIGPIEYQVLPRYAHWFDVATIPFRINEITEAASPIKLFEYMALGRPIVTTDMAECRKYKSVLIGKDHDEFIRRVDEALALKDDKEYGELLKREAKENTWESKVESITQLLRSGQK